MKHLLAALLLLLAAGNAAAQEFEHILDFDSDIVIDASGSMIVTEDIRVRALGDSIQHGIYRDFPTDYKDAHGNPVKIGFKMLGAQRDGQNEPFRTEPLVNGIRVYLGQPDVKLPPDEYLYRIRYRTTRQIGFFEQGDELYWNVTGNGWIFNIDHASVRIHLPQPVRSAQLSTEAYTGAPGAKGGDWEAHIPGPGVAEFKTTRKLGPGQGLTVVLGFPKNIVKPLPQVAGHDAAEERERILDFHSDIAIDADGSMTVTEDVRVLALGKQIRHGIYRDFPTDYKDAHGNPVNVGFELLGTELDQHAEPHRIERLDNGIRIYLGRRETLVSPGEHLYRIRYRSTRQLGFFERHDELYWNATGDGWIFPIDHASASVRLPQPVPVADLAAEAYTGIFGEKGGDWTVSAKPGVADFETTRQLLPREGLTLVLQFPKNIVRAPLIPYQYYAWMAAFAVLVLVLMVHYTMWWRVGRDPPGRVIYPLYTPPPGFSPALLRTVWLHGSDTKCFTADLVSLAARGAISIYHDSQSIQDRLTSARGSEWKLSLIKTPDNLPESEALLLNGLPLNPEMDFSPLYGESVEKTRDWHQSMLASKLKPYFNANHSGNLPGFAASLAATAGMILWIHKFAVVGAVLAVLPLLLCIMVGARGTAALIEKWPQKMKSGQYAGGMLYGLFACVIVAGCLLAVYGLYAAVMGSAMGVLAAALIVVNGVFITLMKVYTPEGRKLLDQIEGLRMYLSVAEKTDLEREKAPPLTAARYQALMPFAIALDVEDAWSRKLTEVAGAAAAATIPADNIFSHNMSGQWSGFSSAAGSCAPPPPRSRSSASSSSSWSGRSSGGGGRGSSGGGGGGGGGGGW